MYPTYPTKLILKTIEKWEILKKGIIPLINLIEENWQFADVGYFKFEKNKNKFKLELHTGGWSGNEDIINSLTKNIFWTVYWIKTERGGHYYFKGKIKL